MSHWENTFLRTQLVRVDLPVGKDEKTSLKPFLGIDKNRLEDLQAALDSPYYKAIFCVRGGYGMSRILHLVDFTKYNTNPKWFIGFSDITFILVYLEKMGHKGGVHALMPSSGYKNEESLRSLENIIFGKGPFTYQAPGHPFNRIGEVKAPIVGGNLDLITNGLGTKMEINTDGKILFIEEMYVFQNM